MLLQVAAAGSQLLARLRAVEAVAKFQAAGEALARMHASGAAPDTQAAQVRITSQLCKAAVYRLYSKLRTSV